MELCFSSFSLNFPLHNKPQSCSHYPLFSVNLSHSVHLSKPHNHNHYHINPLKKFLPFSSPSHQFSFFNNSFSVNSTRVVLVSASSTSSTAQVKKDELPAELDVTEFQEPNSRQGSIKYGFSVSYHRDKVGYIRPRYLAESFWRHRVRLSVHVPPAVCDDCYQMVLKELMKQVKIPGFRPGKYVPEGILLNYAGKQNVEKATVESILTRTLPHAMSSVDGRALKDSVRITTKFSDMEEMYTTSTSLRYDVLVDVMPEVKWNPEDAYKNLEIVVEIDNEITAEIACERELSRRHKTLGPLRIVTDRGLQVGDVVVIDISAATIEQDGDNTKTIPSNESKGFNFDTEEGDIVVPGFLDSIIGIRPGETKLFPLVFPESWKQEQLRGVHALFTVECKELFYRDLPVLDDSLADKLLPGCSTLSEVKEALLQKCQQVEQTAKEQAFDNAILDQLRKMVEVEIPQSLFEEEGRQMYGARLLEIQAKMKLNDEQLASLTNPKAVNEYIEHEKENIIQIIKQNLAVGDIFKRENLQVSTEEIVKEVKNSIEEFKRHKQEYDEDRIKEQVQEVLEGAKVLEWLRERAEVQYITQ